MKISPSPHIHSKFSVPKIMWNVVIALIPCIIASFYFFGIRALIIEALSVITALITEASFQLLTKRRITIFDGSAVITGLLLAFNLPPGIPLYIVVIGSFFAVGIVKHLFGGLGYNIFNPALAGRVFVFFSFLPEMTKFEAPINDFLSLASPFAYDAVTKATPLAINKLPSGFAQLLSEYESKLALYKSLFIGDIPGCIGETSKLAILIGAVYLMWKKILPLPITLSYLLTVVALCFAFKQDPIFHLLSGGLMLGVFFMATDYVTSPYTLKGRIVYGVGCGLFTMLLRMKTGMPEGVSFSILTMNALTPYLERIFKSKSLGVKK